MAKRITDEQIALARQYFIDGYSLPEAASMSRMSLASCKKYLKDTIQTYINEHTEAANRRKAKAEIMPEPTTFNLVMTDELIEDVIIDDGTVESLREVDDNKIMLETQLAQDKLAAEELDQQMTDAQFISLLEYEFSQALNYEQAKELYWEYKPQATINITRVEAFRAIYESTLNRLTSKPKATTKQPEATNKVEVKPSTTTTKLYAQGMGRLEWGTTISEIRDSLDIKLPMPRKKSMIEWDDLRLSEHIIFWVYQAYKDEFEQSFNKTLKLYDTAAKRYELIDKLVNKLQRSPVERELELLQAQVKKLEELGVSREDILSHL